MPAGPSRTPVPPPSAPGPSSGTTPLGTSVTSAWDATVTSAGTHWTAKNVGWNGTLAPGASVSFGYNGAGPGAPSGCKINGAACDGTSQPGDNAPSAPGTPVASGITDTSVKLTWTAATDDKGIKNYDVKRDGTTVATVTGLTYTNTGLTHAAPTTATPSSPATPSTRPAPRPARPPSAPPVAAAASRSPTP